MVGDTQVAELESEADKVGNEVRCMDAAVDEYGPVDIRMICGRVDCRLSKELVIVS